MKLVVGLGNPGRAYEHTRHNAGWQVLDEFAKRRDAVFRRSWCRPVQTAKTSLEGAGNLLLAKPLTYMNTSGGPVSALLKYYDATPEQLIVVHDELDIPFDTLRLKRGGGEGGHNGLRDIIAQLGNQNGFHRLRLGIGHPGHSSLVSGFVLGRAPRAEQELLDTSIDFALGVLPEMLDGDWTRAMQKLHSQKA